MAHLLPPGSVVARLPRVPTRALRQVTTLVSCICAIVSLGSCDKVPLLAPTESTITLVSDRTVVPVNGTAQIIATLIEQSGTPAHNGTLVTFTTTLGALDPREAVTSNGQAVVTLRAGTESGTAEVGAFSGSARTEAPVMILIGGAAAAAVTVSANPAAVPPTGDTVTILAAVTDASGNRLTGVPVSFTSSAGTLANATVITDSTGEARTTLTTDRETTVTATAGAFSSSVAIGLSALPSVTIVATPTTTSVGEPVTFAVSVTAGSSAIREVSVNFGDGTDQALGALAGATNVAHTYTFAGTFQVVATVTDSSGATVTVATVLLVEAAAPLNVTITAPATVQVNVPATFTATATQPAGTLEIDRYEWNFGDGQTAVTTGSVTSHVYTSSGLKVATVRAVEKDGRSGTGRVEVNVTPVSPLNVNLVASPSPGTVAEVVTFTATATGTTIPISSYAWNFGDGSTVTTSGSSVNHVYTTAGAITVTVTATTVEGVTGSTQITLVIEPSVFSVSLTFSPARPDASTVVTFTALVTPSTTVTDRYEWLFGDGTLLVTTSSNTTPHTFSSVSGPSPQTFIVTVTVFRTVGGVSTSTSSEVAVTVAP